jgi:hypothetical protein
MRGAALNEHVTLELVKDGPLGVEFKIQYGSRSWIRYYLAPKMKEEDDDE